MYIDPQTNWSCIQCCGWAAVRGKSEFLILFVLSHLMHKIHVLLILQDKLSASQKETALKEMPSLMEITAFSYFPGSFLVGPQFSMKRYLDYVHNVLIPKVYISWPNYFWKHFFDSNKIEILYTISRRRESSQILNEMSIFKQFKFLASDEKQFCTYNFTHIIQIKDTEFWWVSN